MHPGLVSSASANDHAEGGSSSVTGGSYGYWCWWGVSTTLFKASSDGQRNMGIFYAVVHVLTYIAVVCMNGIMAFDFAANDPAQDMAAAAFGTTLASLLVVVGLALLHFMNAEPPTHHDNHEVNKTTMVYSPVMLSAIMAGSRASIVFDFMAYIKIGQSSVVGVSLAAANSTPAVIVDASVAPADKVQAFQLFVVATITLKFYLAAIMTNNLRFLSNNFVAS